MLTITPRRCLIACLKFLGRCACPDCLSEKDQYWKMGTKNDMTRRVKRPRVDDRESRRRLRSARNFIFKHGKGPDSKKIDDLLQEDSLQPTRVSAFAVNLTASDVAHTAKPQGRVRRFRRVDALRKCPSHRRYLYHRRHAGTCGPRAEKSRRPKSLLFNDKHWTRYLSI